MPRLRESVVSLPLPGDPVLWSAETGRHARLSVEALAAVRAGDAPAPVWRRLRSLGMTDDAELGAAVLRPCRHRRVLLLPRRAALWLPDPQRRTAGGFAYRARPLSSDEAALWRAANGARTVAQAAAVAGVTPAAAARFYRSLAAADVQALQLRPRPPHPRDPGLDRLVALPRPAGPRAPHQTAADGATTLARWHAELASADRHFDDRETTVAHAFARPHPALGGRPFGAALFDALDARGRVPQTGTTLEIGGGSGELGRDFWAAAQAAGRPEGPALRLDASPALLSAQARLQPHTVGHAGTARALPFPDESLDLVLCNEVLADLEAAPLGPAVAARLDRHGLDRLPPGSRYNLGAWELVEELARALAPGGSAYLSEFGALDEVPTETTQLDHPEVSIHFGHAAAVARGCGLRAEVVPLADLLGMDLSARWLSRASYDALRALWSAAGGGLEARAWTAATAPTPEPVEGLFDAPVAQDGPGPVVTRFQALLLDKPG